MPEQTKNAVDLRAKTDKDSYELGFYPFKEQVVLAQKSPTEMH